MEEAAMAAAATVEVAMVVNRRTQVPPEVAVDMPTGYAMIQVTTTRWATGQACPWVAVAWDTLATMRTLAAWEAITMERVTENTVGAMERENPGMTTTGAMAWEALASALEMICMVAMVVPAWEAAPAWVEAVQPPFGKPPSLSAKIATRAMAGGKPKEA
jgi:hypothetical protein